MAREQSVGVKLAALNALRDAGPSSDADEPLRQALADRSNRVVARAAEVAGDLEIEALETDPECRVVDDRVRKFIGQTGLSDRLTAMMILGY